MNLNQLRFVQAVARQQSFSRAAEQCHVTQPTLSNGVAQLEDELGARLFDRTTRSVKLTPFGKHLLPSINRTLADVEEIRALAKGWRNPEHRLVRFGVSPVVDMRLLLEVLAPFRERFPDVELFFKECVVDDLDARLSVGEIDLMLFPRREPGPGQGSSVLYAEPLLYLPREGGPLAGSDQAIRMAEAAQERLILTMDGCGLRPVTLGLFADGGHAIQEYPGQAISYRAVEEWASLGIGGGILPRSKISAGSTLARPLLTDDGEPVSVTLQLVWQSAITGGAHLDALIDYLQTRGRQLALEIAA